MTLRATGAFALFAALLGAPVLDTTRIDFNGEHFGVRISGILREEPAEADPTRIKTLQEQMPLIAARDWMPATGHRQT